MKIRRIDSAGLFCLALALAAQAGLAADDAKADSSPQTPATATQGGAPGGMGFTYGRSSPSDSPIFPTPAYFRRHFSTPPARVELRPPVRLEEYLVDGKLELSLRSYVDLVMANNTDIDIQRVSLDIQQNAVTRAFGAFDPFLLGNFSSTRTKTPTTDVLAGAETRNDLNQPASFTYNQMLSSGLQYNVGFLSSKTSTNNQFAVFNPAFNAQLSAGFTQPLLRNRGGYITRLPITIARGRLRSAEYGLSDQTMRLLVVAESAYWDLVGARENLRVQEQALELNAAALKRSQRELELGAISPLDIYQPEAIYASSEIQVSQARYRVQQAEDALRRQMGADLDPRIRNLPIVLTEAVLPPTDETEIDREGMVERALALRPDLKANRNNIEIDDLSIQQAANNLRPDLALTGRYVSVGRGGTFYQRQNVFGQQQIVGTIPGGFGDALDQLFGFGFPIYSFGLQLRLPLRDRAAEANMADAVVSKRLNTLRARNLEQQIRQDVLQAVSQVEASKAAVKLAIVARDLAQKQLDAEQKKYELGTTVIFFVLDAQTRLVQQESQLVNQSIQYRRNLINLLQRTGELLEARGVAIQ